jgi:Nif-specific regulatory protein
VTDYRFSANADLAAIHEVGKLLSATRNLERALGTTLRTLQSMLGFDRAAILLPDVATREIRMEAGVGYSRDEAAKARYVWGEGIVGKTAKTGSPIAIPDVRLEPMFLDKTGIHADSSEPVAYLSVPIKIGNEVLGVLTATRIGQSGPQGLEGDTRTLAVIGLLIAQAMKLNAAFERLQEEFQRQRQEFEKTIRKTYRIENIIGQSKRMQDVFASVVSVAASRATVLLRGESGTGKEMIARAIHLAGKRAERPMITVNCAALPETLLESELFGHKKGAFTGAVEERKGRFEEASGGTIFLDEIGDIPLSTQVKLLRVLQERKFERLGENRTVAVDVRIIAATNADLEKMVEAGKFREDLYYRLNVIPLFLPPLRDRREDILPLLEHFLDRFNREHGKNLSFSPDAVELLLDYRWPGNVRELENLVERTVVMAKAAVIQAHDLPRGVRIYRAGTVLTTIAPPPENGPEPALPGVPATPAGRPAASRADYLKDMEKEELRRALEEAGWVIARAAKLLGWTPRQVAYKMKKYALVSPWKNPGL